MDALNKILSAFDWPIGCAYSQQILRVVIAALNGQTFRSNYRDPIPGTARGVLERAGFKTGQYETWAVDANPALAAALSVYLK